MSEKDLKDKLNSAIIEKLHENQLYREAMRIAPDGEKDKIANAAEQFVIQFFSIVNLANRKLQEEKEKAANDINKNKEETQK